MSRNESSRAIISVSVTPLAIGTDRRPTLFSLPACLWARDLHNGKSIQHVLAASKSRASEEFGPRGQSRNLDSIGPKTTSSGNYPGNPQSTRPTATCNRVTTTPHPGSRLCFRRRAHSFQLAAYDLKSPSLSAEQTVPVIAEKPS